MRLRYRGTLRRLGFRGLFKAQQKLAKKAFRAVGYAVKGNALNVMILPDSVRYGAGKRLF